MWVTDLARPASLQFAASILTLPLRSERIACSVSLSRNSIVVQTVKEKEKVIDLIPGQTVLCDLRPAFQDPGVFPNPSSVDLERDEDLSSLYGWGQFGFLDSMSKVALTTMLKTVGKLKNLRREKGVQGLIFLNPEHSSYTPFPTMMKIIFELLPPSKK